MNLEYTRRIGRRRFIRTAAGVASAAGVLRRVAAGGGDVEKPVLRFIVVADTHWGGYDDWRPARKDRTIEAVNQECARRRTDFVVLNGDIIHDDPDTQVPRFKPDLQQFAVPVYMTHGNHDIMTDAQFVDFVGHPKDHHFPVGDYACVLLNTYAAPPAVAYGNHSGGHVCPDLAFLEQALKTYRGAPHVFVFAHRCPTDNVQCAEWLELLRCRPNVSGFFGHAHTRWESVDCGGTICHFSGHNTDEANRRGWQAWHSFRVVEVGRKGIRTWVQDYTTDTVRSSHRMARSGA